MYSTASVLLFFLFSSFISLIADGPHHYHPACGHKGSSHLSPVHALQFFYRDASSALLRLVNQWLNFTYSRSHASRYERKNTNSTGKNRTHDFRTSRCAAYLLDNSGDCILYTVYCNKDDAVGGGGPRLVLSVPFFLSFLFCFVMFFVLFLILLSL